MQQLSTGKENDAIFVKLSFDKDLEKKKENNDRDEWNKQLLSINKFLKAAKRIYRYIKGTLNYDICYKQIKDFKLYFYIDIDWAGYAYDRKNTSRFA